jgi:hypothetical protein
MFGWRLVGTTTGRVTKRYGFRFMQEVGQVSRFEWYWGVSAWFFYRYGERNRLTGPESNMDVLYHFFTGVDRRKKDGGFKAAFAEAAQREKTVTPSDPRYAAARRAE